MVLGFTKTINSIRSIYICDTLLITLKNFKNKQDNLRKYVVESIIIII